MFESGMIWWKVYNPNMRCANGMDGDEYHLVG